MANSPTLIFYHAPGTCSQVVHIALEECGLAFEVRPLSLMRGEHKTPEYLAIHPLGKVPTLVIDGTLLHEGLAIIGWLDAQKPGLLLPIRDNDLARAQDRSLLSLLSATIHPIFTRFRVPPAIVDDPGQFAAVARYAAPALGDCFTYLASLLTDREWLLGSYSAADIFTAWLWSEALNAGFDGSAWPSLETLRARVHARPAARRALGRERETIRAMERFAPTP